MQIAKGSIGNVIVFRLPPGEDILSGLKRACELSDIHNGVILSGIGSLNGARFYDPVSLPQKKAGYGYGEAIILAGPIELINLSGMLCQGEKGETLFHIHCGLSDEHGAAYGGHLIEGNTVLLTVEITIAELTGIHMGRKYDPDLEVYVLNPI